jgi:hypothetical protein
VRNRHYCTRHSHSHPAGTVRTAVEDTVEAVVERNPVEDQVSGRLFHCMDVAAVGNSPDHMPLCCESQVRLQAAPRCDEAGCAPCYLREFACVLTCRGMQAMYKEAQGLCVYCFW